jgi:hypothetical protein
MASFAVSSVVHEIGSCLHLPVMEIFEIRTYQVWKVFTVCILHYGKYCLLEIIFPCIRLVFYCMDRPKIKSMIVIYTWFIFNLLSC